MSEGCRDSVERVLGELFRQPEPQRDPGVERAVTRLQAARPDAAYLLLHRVLVLETALQQLRQRGGAVITSVAGPSAATTPARSFLRDAAVVTAGVVAGQVLWQGLGDAVHGDGGGGLDVEGWL